MKDIDDVVKNYLENQKIGEPNLPWILRKYKDHREIYSIGFFLVVFIMPLILTRTMELKFNNLEVLASWSVGIFVIAATNISIWWLENQELNRFDAEIFPKRREVCRLLLNYANCSSEYWAYRIDNKLEFDEGLAVWSDIAIRKIMSDERKVRKKGYRIYFKDIRWRILACILMEERNRNESNVDELKNLIDKVN